MSRLSLAVRLPTKAAALTQQRKLSNPPPPCVHITPVHHRRAPLHLPLRPLRITSTSTTMATSSVPAYRATSASPSTRKVAKSSATASATSSRRSDPFYGHEETAVLCARFITSLFQCPNIPTATAPGAPTPTLAHFVAYALHRTRLPPVVTFAALLLLQRLKTRFPAARGSSGHRLFISAFMIASKIICDDTYSNQSWSIVAQKMFALKEINQMEREMCGYLEWNLNVQGNEVADFENKIRAEHGPHAVASSSSSSSSIPIIRHPQHAYPTPTSTPDTIARPIRPVPSPYRHKPSQPFPSPPTSPPPFSSANSSLVSSPASDDCKTPSPVAMTSQARPSSKGMAHIMYPHRAPEAVRFPINAGIGGY